MYLPDLESFTGMIDRSGLVPVYRTLIADLDTPLTLFAKVAGDRQHAFLFESMEGGEKWGRYSFIGLDPLVTFTSQGDNVSLNRPGQSVESEQIAGCNPLDELNDCSSRLIQPIFPGSLDFMVVPSAFSVTIWFALWRSFPPTRTHWISLTVPL